MVKAQAWVSGCLGSFSAAHGQTPCMLSLSSLLPDRMILQPSPIMAAALMPLR